MSDVGTIVDGNHALHAGRLLGTLIRVGIDVSPMVDDNGNYTAGIEITSDDTTWRVVVMPPEGSDT